MMVVNFGLLGVFSSYYYVVFEPKLHESCLYVLILQVFASGEHANATQGRPEPRFEHKTSELGGKCANHPYELS